MTFQTRFSVQSYNIGKNVNDMDIGIHAYCSWT